MNYLQEYCLTFYALKLITCLCLYGRLNGVMFQKYGACMNSFILSFSRPNHALMPPHFSHFFHQKEAQTRYSH